MQKIMQFIVVLSVVLLSVYSTAALSKDSTQTVIVPRYGIFEQTFDWNSKSYTNPWEQAQVTMILTSPTGKQITVGGFYYGTNTWKAHFAPAELGKWLWQAILIDNTKTSRINGSFTVVKSNSPGFIRRNSDDPHRWMLDGKPFYPVGIGDCIGEGGASMLTNWGFDGRTRPPDDESGNRVDIDTYLKAYKDAGFNLFRWSVGNCAFNLDSENDWLEGDKLVSKLKQYGFRIQLALFHKNSNASEAELAFVKKVIDRYGKDVDIWEVCNQSKDTDSTLNEIANYIKERDPYGHPVITSLVYYRQLYSGADEFSINKQNYENIVNWKRFGKPVIVGEYSNERENWDATSDIHNRLSTWTAFFAEGMLVFWNSSFINNYAPTSSPAPESNPILTLEMPEPTPTLIPIETPTPTPILTPTPTPTPIPTPIPTPTPTPTPPSNGSGFIRRNPDNPHRWMLDGKPFYPIGIGDCIGEGGASVLTNWGFDGRSRPPAPENGDRTDIDTYLKAYSDAGFNLFRWSVNNCAFNLDSEHNWLEGDKLVRKLRQYGFRIMFVFFNNRSDSSPAGLAYVKKAIDRYGEFVDVWEIVNETTDSDNELTAIANYIKERDPFGRPITSSFQPWNEVPGRDLAAFGAVSPHWYYLNNTDFTADIDTWNRMMEWKKFGKPVIVGENGNYSVNWDVTSAMRMRLRSWTAFFAEGVLIFWNSSFINNYASTNSVSNIYLGTEERRFIRVMQDFTKNVPADARIVAIQVNQPAFVRGYALSSPDGYFAYLHAFTNHTSATGGITVTVVLTRTGTATWIEPSTGRILGSTRVSAGRQTLTVPPFLIDAALKVSSSPSAIR